MRRARYYIFIPVIYLHLERKGFGYRAFREKAEERQHELQRVLLRAEGKRKGVIGENARERLQRLPSNVYWSAFTDLGILAKRGDGRAWSEVDYQRNASAAGDGDLTVHADDGHDEEDALPNVWDPDLPRDGVVSRAGRFRSPLGFQMTALEAGYLRRKFLEMSGGTESLLGFRLTEKLGDPYDYPWDVKSRRMP